jgi:AcrR family transcriptional regulator
MKIKDEEKYQRIIDAATFLLINEGLDNFSTTKVAKKVGIAQSNIYLYFKNKKELLQRIFSYHVHQMSAYVNNNMLREGSTHELLVSSTDQLIVYALANPESLEIIEMLKHSRELKLAFMPKVEDWENEKIQAILRQGLIEGALRPTNINFIRFFMLATVREYTYAVTNKLYTTKEVSPKEVRNTILCAIEVKK